MSAKKLLMAAIGLFAGYKLYKAANPKIPDNVVPVTGFELNHYLGKWYEVARVENRFEKGLIKTTAEYTLNGDGTVNVLNSGVDEISGRHKHASGTAVFVRGQSEGALKVSFFGPFYGGYNIVALDEDYRWAIIVGSSPKYFWVLSRTAEIPEELKDRAIKVASGVGVDPDNINWVQQF